LTIDGQSTPDTQTRGLAVEELGTLFDRQYRRLYALARRLCHDGDEAQDLVQETFLRAARKLETVPRDTAHAEAWLVRVLVNLSRDRTRRQSVRRRHAAELIPGREAEASESEDAAVARVTVHAGLSRLTTRQRAVVVLHELEGLPTARIAELLGIHRVTVRWHLSAARRQLAKWLGAATEGTT